MVRIIDTPSGEKLCVYYRTTIPESDVVYVESTNEKAPIEHTNESAVNNPEQTARIEVSDYYGFGFQKEKRAFFDVRYFVRKVAVRLPAVIGTLLLAIGSRNVAAIPPVAYQIATIGIAITVVYMGIALFQLFREIYELYYTKAVGICDPNDEWNSKYQGQIW